LNALYEMVKTGSIKYNQVSTVLTPVAKKLKLGSIELKKNYVIIQKNNRDSDRSKFDNSLRHFSQETGSDHFIGNGSPELSELLSESSLTFQDLVKIISLFDPLEYWSSSQIYPHLYQANLINQAYLASNSFQESVFSFASDTIGDKRQTLLNNPSLFEASTCLRVLRSLE